MKVMRQALFAGKVMSEEGRLAYARLCVEVGAGDRVAKEIKFRNKHGVEL